MNMRGINLQEQYPEQYQQFASVFKEYLHTQGKIKKGGSDEFKHSLRECLAESLKRDTLINGRDAYIEQDGDRAVFTLTPANNQERTIHIDMQRRNAPELDSLRRANPKKFQKFYDTLSAFCKQKNFNINANNKNEILAKSLASDLLIDGVLAILRPSSGNKFVIVPTAVGLINLVHRATGGYIRTKTWYMDQIQEFGCTPSIDDNPIIPASALKSAETLKVWSDKKRLIDDVAFICVGLFVDGKAVSETIVSGAEILEKAKHAINTSPAWKGDKRWTDPLEMMTKTAIKHCIKRLPCQIDHELLHPEPESPPDLQKPTLV